MDKHAEKVYAAENVVFADEDILTEFKVRKFFYEIIGDPWFKDKYGEGYGIYVIGDFFDHSFAYRRDIYILDPIHLTESSVCHEIGHSCKQVRSNPHGKAWQKRYVELVGKYICAEKSEELAEEFKKIVD